MLCPMLAISQTKSTDVVGVWLTELKDGKIEIYQKDNKFFGKVVWIASPNDENGQPLKDINNPKDALKSRPILGMNTIVNMSYDDGVWSGGTVYDPKTGDSYTCKIWLEGANLKVRGYWGVFYETKTWTKSK